VLKRKSTPRRRVTLIVGARAREICDMEAKTADEAIMRATREYGMDPERQKRLAA
jgi:hypothetical protein